MACPEEIADVVLQILETGIVAARFAAWHNDSKLAAIEASHVHNLPALLRRYELEKLEWYWNAERPAYMEAFAEHIGSEPEHFREHWQRLEPLVPKE